MAPTIRQVASHLVENPHYYRGTVVARWTSYLATLLWGLFTILREFEGAPDDGTSLYALFSLTMPYFPQWAYALTMAGIAAAQIWRLVFHLRPVLWGTVLNAIIALFWLYNAIVINLVLYPIRPVGASCSIVLAIVSWCAFVSNPRPIIRKVELRG